jgi:preprotein translocase subunit Sec63
VHYRAPAYCFPVAFVAMLWHWLTASICNKQNFHKQLKWKALLVVRTTLMNDLYAALGLDSAASLADIKKAFRQKASALHPDKNTAPDAPERYRAVQEAYDILSDADKRQAYDDNRRRNLLDSPIDTAKEIWNQYFRTLV